MCSLQTGFPAFRSILLVYSKDTDFLETDNNGRCRVICQSVLLRPKALICLSTLSVLPLSFNLSHSSLTINLYLSRPLTSLLKPATSVQTFRSEMSRHHPRLTEGPPYLRSQHLFFFLCFYGSSSFLFPRLLGLICRLPGLSASRRSTVGAVVLRMSKKPSYVSSSS